MLYYIYYHSASQEQENRQLLNVIKSFPGWAILSPSFFLIREEEKKQNDTDVTILKIKEKVRNVCSSNDEFFIGQMGDKATWQGYGGRLRDWLIENALKKEEKDLQQSFSAADAAKAAYEAIIKAQQRHNTPEVTYDLAGQPGIISADAIPENAVEVPFEEVK